MALGLDAARAQDFFLSLYASLRIEESP